jgi:succinate-semialdehyde dehydrogenase/glutarate-semialdehyde dehydrogenase
MATATDTEIRLIPDPEREYGSWILGEELPHGRSLEVLNPFEGKPIGRILVGGTEVGDAAVETAERAFPIWSSLSYSDRGRYLARFAQLIERYQDTLSNLIVSEQGKPVTEALVVELFATADFWRHLARHTETILAAEKTVFHNPMLAGRKGEIRFEPAGPTLIITPWNFPLLIPALEVAQALAVGNTVVLKPSLITPFTALAIQRLAEEAGIPPGVVNTALVTDEAAVTLVQHPGIARISFTGGEYSGHKIMRAAADALKSATLEMRGKDAAIVAADCNLERTAVGVAWWGLSNAGQVRIGIERVYVVRSIAEKFLQQLAAVCRSLRMGDPHNPQVDIGPMTIEKERNTVHEHVVDAVARGAEILCGAAVPDGPGTFYPPTLLAGTNHDMHVMRDVTFGPVLPVMIIDSLEEAVEMANDSRYGLAASVWTEDRHKAEWVAKRLRVGMVGINDHASGYVEPSACFGGEGFSGVGRSHGRHGLASLTRIKHVSYEYRAPFAAWWFPYTHELKNFLSTALTAIHQQGFIRKLTKLRRLITMRHFRRSTRFGVLIRRWRSLF